MSSKIHQSIVPDHEVDFSGVSGRATAGIGMSAEPLVPGTDAAIHDEVGRLVGGVEDSSLPGETVSFKVAVSSGAVKVTGSTNSVMLYKSLYELVPKLKALQGVKSVDISGVAKP